MPLGKFDRTFLANLDRAALRRALRLLRRQDAYPRESNPAAAQYAGLATTSSVRAEYARRNRMYLPEQRYTPLDIFIYNNNPAIYRVSMIRILSINNYHHRIDVEVYERGMFASFQRLKEQRLTDLIKLYDLVLTNAS